MRLLLAQTMPLPSWETALFIGGPICAFLVIFAFLTVFVWTKAAGPAMATFAKTVENMTKLSENVKDTAQSLERMHIAADAREKEQR